MGTQARAVVHAFRLRRYGLPQRQGIRQESKCTCNADVPAGDGAVSLTRPTPLCHIVPDEVQKVVYRDGKADAFDILTRWLDTCRRHTNHLALKSKQASPAVPGIDGGIGLDVFLTVRENSYCRDDASGERCRTGKVSTEREASREHVRADNHVRHLAEHHGRQVGSTGGYLNQRQISGRVSGERTARKSRVTVHTA